MLQKRMEESSKLRIGALAESKIAVVIKL